MHTAPISTAYTATFADGSVKRLKNSTRQYAAAWRVGFRRVDGDGRVHFIMGFARDHGMARAAAKREFASTNSTPRHVRQRGEVRKPYNELVSIEVVDAIAKASGS